MVLEELLQAQGYGKQQHSFWVPKHMQSACPTIVPWKLSSQTSTKRTLPRWMSPNPIKKQWVPKVLLEAQGYYKGVCCVWIPGHTTKEPSPKPRLDDNPILVNLQQHTKVSKQWKPKATPVKPLPQDKAMVKVCDTTLTYQNPPLQKEKNIGYDHASQWT